MANLRVGLVQLNTQSDRAANLAAIERLVGEAAARGARFVMLPEYAPYLGPKEGYQAGAETVPGPLTDRFAALARQHGVYLHAGSMVERTETPGKYGNTTVVFDPAGEIIAKYRKIHLFDIEIPGKVSAKESDSVAPGDEIVTVAIEGITFGLAICYDLRFPELFRLLALQGAEVLCNPAAFTLYTGKDHWEVLLRARAIENQAWMLAAAQWGPHEPNAACYGRSLAIDPWGTVTAQASDGVGVVVTEIDTALVRKNRTEVPSLANRQPAAYTLEPRGVAVPR
jgi:deaminated glutathione amidase